MSRNSFLMLRVILRVMLRARRYLAAPFTLRTRSAAAAPALRAALRAGLGAGLTAYSFSNDAALAISASYSIEADAIIDDALVPSSARSVATLSVSGVWPISDQTPPPVGAIYQSSDFELRPQSPGHSWRHIRIRLRIPVKTGA